MSSPPSLGFSFTRFLVVGGRRTFLIFDPESGLGLDTRDDKEEIDDIEAEEDDEDDEEENEEDEEGEDGKVEDKKKDS